jgi:peptidoglycan/xylan/chitin deacetylase (PgdA/CDA1 family)
MNFKTIISRILPKPQGLRVLMYHKFSSDAVDYLTVNAAQFEEEIAYLKRENYVFIKLSDVLKAIKTGDKLPKNAVLLTFDDAYISQRDLAEPILRKFQANGVMFVPTAFVGLASNWDVDAAPILSVSELKKLDPSVWELGLHSHTHLNFKKALLDEIIVDMAANIGYFNEQNLQFVPALAYPYGARPEAPIFQKMQIELQNMDIKIAFRIGNRVNQYPLSKIFEIQRIDVRGTDSMENFIFKLTFGRLM